jgi:hypothetical protein
MKRRTEHLVEKRDGRREFLRATKLARSVHLALFEIGIDEDWRALDLAGVVLEGLREKRSKQGEVREVVLRTSEIADSVQHLLVVTGQPAAAVSYGAVQAERARRRDSVGQTLATMPAINVDKDASATRGVSRSKQVSAHTKHQNRFGGRWPGEG